MTNKQNDRPVLEAILEGGEVIVDAIMNGDVLADVPVIGSAIKLCRAKDSFRDRLSAGKLQTFLDRLGTASDHDKQKIKDRVASSPAEAQKIGEMLVMVIDQVTDFQKPQIMASLFLCFVDGVISGVELRRLIQAIATAFLDDLIDVLSSKEKGVEPSEVVKGNLVATGLTKIYVGGSFGNLGEVSYDFATLGNTLMSAHAHRKLI